jgi:hypothetical protein
VPTTAEQQARDIAMDRLTGEYAGVVDYPSVLGCVLAAARAVRRGRSGGGVEVEKIARRLLESMAGDRAV